MTELIGPFDNSDFILMQDIRKSIDYCTKKDYSRFEISIKKHNSILKDLFSRRVA